jgi:alpha-glucuronidase
MKKRICLELVFCAVILAVVSCSDAQKVEIYFHPSPQVDFAFSELRKVMGTGNIQGFLPDDFSQSKTDVKIALLLQGEANTMHGLKNEEEKLKGLTEEGFSIVVKSYGAGREIYVIGYDEPGLMYGIVERAEQIGYVD